MNEQLRVTIDRVAKAFGRVPDAVEVAFVCVDGHYDWTVRLAVHTLPHGRGRKIIQPALFGSGESPQSAADDLLERYLTEPALPKASRP